MNQKCVNYLALLLLFMCPIVVTASDRSSGQFNDDLLKFKIDKVEVECSSEIENLQRRV